MFSPYAVLPRVWYHQGRLSDDVTLYRLKGYLHLLDQSIQFYFIYLLGSVVEVLLFIVMLFPN